MSEIIDEINEELAQERALNVLKKYYKHIIAGILFVVLIVAGLQLWEYWNAQNAKQRASEFSSAIQVGGVPNSPESLQVSYDKIQQFIAKDKNDQFQVIALTKAINLALQLNKTEDYQKFLGLLAKTDKDYLGDLRFVYGNLAQNQDKLQKITNEKGTYIAVANFILAEQALQANETTKAKEYLQKVAIANSPLAAVAKEILGVLP